ncbi:exocyst complex component 1 [Plutella xylostella]|uniref:exocyst complex component 1 n=1 Tax=Plutella xylostella TaxID=51655 RepID=UPI002032F500|nr:exocyst complex component 1 [Plutella xylostella]
MTLGEALAAGGDAGAALRARVSRYEALLRGAPDAVHARTGAARAERNARRLLEQLESLLAWLDVEPLEFEPELGSAAGRARALAAADALRTALKTTGPGPCGAELKRLSAVRERMRRVQRAKERYAAAIGRHLNNLLIHAGNAAAAAPAAQHHQTLLQYRGFMRWLREMDERTYDALMKVYVSTWSKVYEREVRSACEAAEQPAAGAAALDNVLSLVETMCNAEQEFVTQFFALDVDLKAEGSDGSRSEHSEGGGAGRAGAEARRLMQELMPTLEAELVNLVHSMEKSEPYGAMRALAIISRRVLAGGGGAEGGAGGALAAAAVAAKRGADRAVQDMIATFPDAVRAGLRKPRAAILPFILAAAVAANRGADRAVQDMIATFPDAVRAGLRKPRAAILPFILEMEEFSTACEAIFAGGRRADLDRWYGSLAAGALSALQGAPPARPGPPALALLLENCHRLHALLHATRTEPYRKEAKARYQEALNSYVQASFGQPLEKLQKFFQGVEEAVAQGTPEAEICYRQQFSKHELRKILALYPAQEVRKSLHRLYRQVEKQLSTEGGLLQVVWRAMQQQLLATHSALQARIAACYPGAGLALPLTTQDILDAFSDIAREN